MKKTEGGGAVVGLSLDIGIIPNRCIVGEDLVVSFEFSNTHSKPNFNVPRPDLIDHSQEPEQCKPLTSEEEWLILIDDEYAHIDKSQTINDLKVAKTNKDYEESLKVWKMEKSRFLEAHPTTIHILWSRIQIVGKLTIDRNWFVFPIPQSSGQSYIPLSLNEPWGDNTRCLFVTPESPLLYAVDLIGGQTRKCDYSIHLPADLPPSFTGSGIKIQYRIILHHLYRKKIKRRSS